MILQLPLPTAVITPLLLTEATLVSVELHTASVRSTPLTVSSAPGFSLERFMFPIIGYFLRQSNGDRKRKHLV